MAPPPSWKLIPAIGAAGLRTGASSIWLPQMPGNGKDIVLESLAGHGTLAGAALALVLKPALPALFIRAGAVGGMLTPALIGGGVRHQGRPHLHRRDVIGFPALAATSMEQGRLAGYRAFGEPTAGMIELPPIGIYSAPSCRMSGPPWSS